MLKTMSTAQAAEYFGVHLKTIFRFLHSGQLKAEKKNGQWHVQIDEHDAQNNAQSNVQTDAHERLIAQQQAEIDHLREQLVRRDEQIESLIQQLDHSQQLLAVQTKTTAALTEQLDASRQMIEDLRQRNWWKRV